MIWFAGTITSMQNTAVLPARKPPLMVIVDGQSGHLHSPGFAFFLVSVFSFLGAHWRIFCHRLTLHSGSEKGRPEIRLRLQGLQGNYSLTVGNKEQIRYCKMPLIRFGLLLCRHECFTGKYTTRKIHKNYIRDPSGLFSIMSVISLYYFIDVFLSI